MSLDTEAPVISRLRSVESYAHKAAKAVLVGWLRDACEADPEDHGVKFCGLRWRVNRPGPNFGIWEEYPLVNRCGAGTGDLPSWDEWGWEEAFGIEPVTRPPTYGECVGLGRAPKVILDVAVQHKGAIVYGFEVVHKHGITPEKRAFLNDARVEVFVLNADWILSQIGVPKALQIVEHFPASWR